MLIGILALVAIVIAFRMRPAKHSSVAVVAVVSPALVMLGLFYSLAAHMHQSLGAWPSSIGERGFPESLITHAYIATNYFAILLFVSIFAWPVVFLLCLLNRRW
jgi:multisubunit Na+/H+ antiporter MnhB subunit